MITDLVQIRRQGELKRAENLDFRGYMKTHGFNERKFRHSAEDVQDQIDCTQCANCCRRATVRVEERTVRDLSKFLRISTAEFVRQYTEESPEEGTILRRTENGCVFLDGNLCSVYEARPQTCINFPHLVRGAGSLISRLWEMPDRATYCPIVFNTLESWKGELSWKPGKR